VRDGLIFIGSPVPRHEFVPAAGGPVVGDPCDDVGDIGLRVDAVGLAGLDDGVERDGTLAAWA
jgi:hypothetical protein